ncbi:MAG: EAL domain-containing protein [Methylotenera sp.]|nr:EAL domain-containing protein [Methylotenera sp.]MDP2281508.1 EAL domain-containing protein [Methylotenera sp.]MDP3060958.1 EAL domain-containing protein [Methylotenera sp.]
MDNKNKLQATLALDSIMDLEVAVEVNQALLERDEELIKQVALKALRAGDFDFALKAVQRGEASIPEMVEDLKIYQAELEVQNEELRQSQLITENAVRRFSNLFASLPIPALMIDEMGVVHECNEMATQRFKLDRKQFRSQYFPRMVKKQDHGRLRKLIIAARDIGQAMISSVALESADATNFIADLHIAILPEQAETEPRFVITIIDQTESIAQRSSLEFSRQHFMAYFDAAPVGMAATSVEKGWIEVNQKLCHMLGYAEGELLRKTWLELTHPDDIVADIDFFNQLVSREIDSYNMDKRFVRKDGSILEAHLAVSALIKLDGSVDYFVAIIEDISARKRAQRTIEARDIDLKKQALQLKERVKELQAIYAISRASEQSPDLETFVSELHRLIPTGMRYPVDVVVSLTMMGKTSKSPAEKTYLSQISSEIVVEGAVRGEVVVGYCKAHDTINIGPFFTEEQAFVNGVADLVGRFLSRTRNEADRLLTIKRNSALLALTTEALAMDEKDLLQRALEQAENLTSSHVAYVYFVNDDQTIIWPGLYSVGGLFNSADAQDSAYPSVTAEYWTDCLRQKKAVVHDGDVAISHSQTLLGGEVQLLRHMSVPVIDGEKVVMVVGVGNKADAYDEGDLTLLEMLANNTWSLLGRNRIQRKLTLDAEVFRYSREAVLVTDSNLNIISVNPAFTLITGYSADEAVGQTPKLLKSGKHELFFYQKMWAEIINAGHWQGEIWNRRKNGEIYPQWLGVSAVCSVVGQVTEYIAVFMDITEHKQTEARVEYLAHHDPLTGLPNRTLLRDRYERSIAFAQREGSMVAVLYLDLDHFKNINDSLGHPVGDKLLIETAARISGCVRDTDTVSRLGGDEFVVLLNDIQAGESVADVASKILESVATPFLIDNKVLNISCSIGVCIYPDDGKGFDQLLQQADISLYQAKGNGRNAYHFFTDEMNRTVARRLNLESELRKALCLKQIYVEYQPQFDIKTGIVIGAEALLRWHHPELGIIPPSEFIPVAEENGSIIELGHYVMLQACYQAKKWVDSGYDLRIAVNVSYAQFVRNNLHQLVVDTLRDTALAPRHLELELTESILVADSTMVLTIVQALKDIGVLFSIDDFGTGYSSLSYLKRFAVGKLKIDQSFVRDVPGDPEDEVIVSAIISLAHSLQLECIAEGVETIEQEAFLKEMGCDQIQGYLHGRPMSVEKMDELLAKQAMR